MTTYCIHDFLDTCVMGVVIEVSFQHVAHSVQVRDEAPG